MQSAHEREYFLLHYNNGLEIFCMCVKQNAPECVSEFPLASEAVHKSFYVDNGLISVDSVEEALKTPERVPVTIFSCRIPPEEMEHE